MTLVGEEEGVRGKRKGKGMGANEEGRIEGEGEGTKEEGGERKGG